jgi:hypothetical protein
MKNILAGVLVLLGFASMAQKPTVVTGDEKGWYNIGKISASFKNERESIVVMGKDEFETIKLRVHDAPLNIDHMQVYFEGGKVQEINVKQPLKAGEETKEFDLNADNKEINKVVFYYSTAPHSGSDQATVELYGYKSHKDGESSRTGIRDDGDEVREDVNDAADRTRDEIREESRDAGNEVEEAADETGDAAREAGEEVGEGSDNLRDDVRHESREAGDKLDEAAEDVEEGAEDVRDEARDEMNEERDRNKGVSSSREDELEEGADNLRDEADEHGTKLKSEITDRELEDKAGPDGQEIYIDDSANYYYVDERGNKVYVSEEQLTDRSQ